jgi:hypothetical protein
VENFEIVEEIEDLVINESIIELENGGNHGGFRGRAVIGGKRCWLD